MINNRKYIFLNNNSIKENNNIYLILDIKYLNYIYIIQNNNIIYNINILNDIYIYFIKNNIYYLIFKIYKYIFNNIFNKIQYKKYQLVLNIIGINYKFYYLKEGNFLIFQLKYSHKIIIKLPNIVFCKLDINKNLIYLYSINIFILNSIGSLINSFQYINKYKELGIKKLI
ncbi:apicoplast ribosomal protein L6 (apicoplast) [Plasmodium gaboni]|uniref:Apicoplast ribosomal protein L6 n=1 Tax=Plasmodium gaboni TaxID=647221 RepID=A0A151LXA2_9APIC|nr:apicoplast ribosomal protein L6 [Plasmodium gaboni]KYO03783.1 apicoplast ribosomal protein L6 [Plasmodium gaboni]